MLGRSANTGYFKPISVRLYGNIPIAVLFAGSKPMSQAWSLLSDIYPAEPADDAWHHRV
jgi:hypothetical protein